MPRKKKLPEGMCERGGVYYCDFYARGRRVRKRLSTVFDTAKELLNELRSRADRADFGLLDNDVSIKEIRKEYLRHCRQTLKPKTIRRYETCLDNIIPELAATRVSQIFPDTLRRYREGRLEDGASPRTVNMELTVLATMLRWAVREQKIAGNPVDGLKPLPHDKPKERRPLTDEEVNRLLEHSPEPWSDIWYAFLVTGMRKDELADLTFEDVDWDAREVVVRAASSKSHKERRISIDSHLWDILCKQRDERGDRTEGKAQSPKVTEQIRARHSKEHVFVTSQGIPIDNKSSLYYAFMRCCKLAGIETKRTDAEGDVISHVDVHSLRTTFATNLIANGADPKSVQELLGHATLDMTMRIYAKIHSGTKRQAISKLSYGKGALVPDHILEYPDPSDESVQNGHTVVTSSESKKVD